MANHLAPRTARPGDRQPQAAHRGAQDYLVKGNADGALLVRAIRYAVERKRAEESIRALSLEDELTGLPNRRGFFALAEQQLKVARRTKTGLFLLFSDVDGLKAMNDQFGHAEGDRLIRDAAHILRATSGIRISWRAWAAMSLSS